VFEVWPYAVIALKLRLTSPDRVALKLPEVTPPGPVGLLLDFFLSPQFENSMAAAIRLESRTVFFMEQISFVVI
jgi:hypothetical protein